MNEEYGITRILQSFLEVKQAFFQVMTKVAEQHNITPVQLIVLRVLYEHPLIGLSALAEKLHTGTSTASGVIDRMELAGLVSRERSETDRRALKLKLTDKGVQQWTETEATRIEMLQPLLELPQEDQEAFLRIQGQIIQILKQIREG